MRLMSVWVSPKTAPTAIEAIATAQTIGRQSHAVALNADVEHPQDRAERGHLRARRHERGHRGRRALVHVRASSCGTARRPP